MFHTILFVLVGGLQALHAFQMPATPLPARAARASLGKPFLAPHVRTVCERKAAATQLRALDLASTAEGVSAWSVTSLTPDLAANLFQASLAPYLAFLWLLKQERTGTPKGGFFGFAFLLVFVGATIPAGIYAKVAYHAILADVDVLHGPAEFLLTLTNLFIVSAFRKAVNGGPGGEESSSEASSEASSRRGGEAILRSDGFATAAAALAAAPLLMGLSIGLHPEPANALSFPTWMVHVSSLVEWLAAMTYVWRYADAVGVPQWKGLTWGMLPLHTSGLCACTFHVMYNSPAVNALVPLQAALTCFGNATMAFAVWRVYQAKKNMGADEAAGVPARAGREADGANAGASDIEFYGTLLAVTLLGSALVKYGELWLDFPFDPSLGPAAALILGPTALNIAKWAERSRNPEAPVDGII